MVSGTRGPLGGRPVLSQERIVALALGIIDEHGLEALNMRRLASEAGVKPMSLYYHFRSKQTLLDAVGESIASGALGASAPDPRWQARVRQLFMGLNALAEAHPRALPLISAAVVRTPSGRRWMEELMRTLLGAGFSAERAASAYHILGAYTLGMGYARLLAEDVRTRDIVQQLAGHWSEYPHLLSVGVQLAAWDRPGEYETGLDVLLAHFAAQVGAVP